MQQFLFVAMLIFFIYVFVVRPKIVQYRTVTGILDVVDAEGYSWWRSLLARLSGYKTVILGSASALLPQLPGVLDEINGFTGWSLFLSSSTADKISACLAAATAVTHVYGLVSAARTVPISTEAPSIPALPKA